ncbi:hypothetical protein GW793_02050 [bacterium]|nr:hypothetical protein [bacterium]
MTRYIGLLSLFLLSIAQVAWAPFLVVFGWVFPVFIVSVWVVYPYFIHRHLLIMTVLGGIILDSMGNSLFGLHTSASILSLLSIHLIETYAITHKTVARFVSFIVSVVIYVLITQGGFVS